MQVSFAIVKFVCRVKSNEDYLFKQILKYKIVGKVTKSAWSVAKNVRLSKREVSNRVAANVKLLADVALI